MPNVLDGPFAGQTWNSPDPPENIWIAEGSKETGPYLYKFDGKNWNFMPTQTCEKRVELGYEN